MVDTVVRDVSGRRLERGRYVVTSPGRRPVIVRCLSASSGTVEVMSLERCAVPWIDADPASPELSWHRISDDIESLEAIDVALQQIRRAAEVEYLSESPLERLGALLGAAAAHRQGLSAVEHAAAELLGCSPGDGTELSDQLMSGVWNGHSSSYELAAMALHEAAKSAPMR